MMRTYEEVDDVHDLITRDKLQEALCQYTSDTQRHIDTVKEFSRRLSKWTGQREIELNLMTDIKERADQISLNIDHVSKSKDKGKALGEVLKSWVTQWTADTRLQNLEKELATVLKNTLEGLEMLTHFLDAVEKLAVTSLHVFGDSRRYQVFELFLGMNLDCVRSVIEAARLVCPLLLRFKRDHGTFFLPNLDNVGVLTLQLDVYIRNTKMICEGLVKKTISGVWQKMTINAAVQLAGDLSESDLQCLLAHVNHLVRIRMDEDFRLAFLFQKESKLDFINEFSQRHNRMLQFLTDLEENAVQLDRMKKGAQISSVAGSSVGVIGGILSIVGLALAPVTVGASLALTMTGVGLGVTSGVNSVVTTVTEMSVNSAQQKKANEVIKNFMEDVETLQGCLETVANQAATALKENTADVAIGCGKVATKVVSIGKAIDSITDGASAVKLLKNEDLITNASRLALQEGKALRNVPKVASDIPDIGQAAVKGPLAMSTAARAGLITVNALFIGVDIFCICTESVNLSKGSKSEVSQNIRSRAALWRSQLDSWQKLNDSLLLGMLESDNNLSTLEMPLNLVKEEDKQCYKVKSKLKKTNCIIQ